LNIDSDAHYTEIRSIINIDLITDNGKFTKYPSDRLRFMKNTSGSTVRPGDIVQMKNTAASGDEFDLTSTLNDKINGVIYDGQYDTLGADANAVQAELEVDDIWQWVDTVGKTVTIIDDASEETGVVLSVNTATDIITLTGNLVNAYTVVANARVLLSFTNNEYCRIMEQGHTDFLHVDGDTDIAVGDYISNYSVDGIGHRGYDNFIAKAFGAYASNNSNGWIVAEIFPMKKATILEQTFAMELGGVSTAFKGWDINAAGEAVVGYVNIPPGITHVLRLEVWGSTRVADANSMMLEITLDAGADNEPNNTHVQTYNTISETQNFIVEDIIHWLVNSGILTDGTLVSGDNVRVIARHEVAAGDDVETNTYIRNFRIYCI